MVLELAAHSPPKAYIRNLPTGTGLRMPPFLLFTQYTLDQKVAPELCDTRRIKI
jgi:hypothetical protein